MSLAKTLFSIQLVLLFSSLATCDEALNNFLQCLPNHVQTSKPILEAIYTPNNSSFQSVFEAYTDNLRFLTPSTNKPLAIITALHESHVQATVICAKFHGLQIRIRSGGHDVEGLSYRSDVPFIILDLFNLRSIDLDIDSETAWVQSGAILGELYYQIAMKSKVHAFPAGVCPSVGAGGHFSGGGYGNLMRKYGLSVDNIIDAQIVDVNGNILDRKSMGEDLFWAIRGGGGASFGVILSWKIKLVRVPAQVTVFSVVKTLEEGATDIFHKYLLLASKIDNELFLRAELDVQNETQKKTVRVSFIGLFLGQASKLLTIMNKNFSELGLKQEDCKQVSWLQSTMFFDNIPIESPPEILLNRNKSGKVFSKTKSDYLKDVMSKKDLEDIWKMLLKTQGMQIQWNPYGGRMSEISDTETPFPHREGYLFKVHYLTIWSEEGKVTTNNRISMSRQMYHSMAPFVSKNPREAFLNYRDLDIGRNPSNVTNFEKAEIYGHKYFKNNFKRLTQVKRKVDPNNFFKNEQSIPPLVFDFQITSP